MAALWMLIFAFKAGTPVEPYNPQILAHFDSNRPIYLLSFRDKVLLAELEQDQQQQSQRIQIP